MGLTPDSLPVDFKHELDDYEDGYTECERDDVYYLRNVVFVVEGCIFQVPSRSLERGSKELQEMITSASGAEGEPTNTINLDGIKKIDFKRLLTVMYPLEIKPRPMTLDEWISVLHLSTLWQLAEIRELAIERMSTFDIEPTDKIVLSHEFDVADWYEPACEELSARSTTLTMEEAKKIGLETSVRIFHAREQSRPCGCSATPAAVFSTTSPVVVTAGVSEREDEEVATAASKEVGEDCTKKDEKRHVTEDARRLETEDAAQVGTAIERCLAEEDVERLEKEEAAAAKNTEEDTIALSNKLSDVEAAASVTKAEEEEVSTIVSVNQAEENATASSKLEEDVALRKAAASAKKAKEEAADAKKKIWKKAKDVAEKKKAEARADHIAQIAARLAKKSADLLAQQASDRLAKEASRLTKEANRFAKQDTDHVAQEETQRFARQEADWLAKEEADHAAKEETQRFIREEVYRLAKDKADRDAKEEADRLASEKIERLATEHLARAEANRFDKEAADLLAQEKAKLLAQEEAHCRAYEVHQKANEQFAREETERIAITEATHLAKQKADYIEIGHKLAARQEASRSVESGIAKIDAKRLQSEAPDHHATAATLTTAEAAKRPLMTLTNEAREIEKAAKKHRLGQLEEARAAAGHPLQAELEREAAKARAEKKARRRLEVRAKKGSR